MSDKEIRDGWYCLTFDGAGCEYVEILDGEVFREFSEADVQTTIAAGGTMANVAEAVAQNKPGTLAPLGNDDADAVLSVAWTGFRDYVVTVDRIVTD